MAGPRRYTRSSPVSESVTLAVLFSPSHYQVPIIVDQRPRLCSYVAVVACITLCYLRPLDGRLCQGTSAHLLVIEGQFYSRCNIMQNTIKVIWIWIFPDTVSRSKLPSKSAYYRYLPEQAGGHRRCILQYGLGSIAPRGTPRDSGSSTSKEAHDSEY
jgi:hypothetical protein